jgi:hypothetical protein
VGVMDGIGWKLQRHPAGGAGIPRPGLTRRGVRRLVFAVGIASWVLVAGSVGGVAGLLTHSALDSTRSQNKALRAQQEILREQAFDLAWRLFEDAGRGRRMARLTDAPGHAFQDWWPHPPARDAGDDALVAWLSEQGLRLEALGTQLAASRVGTGPTRAPSQASRTGISPTTGRTPATLVADSGSDARRGVAPARP